MAKRGEKTKTAAMADDFVADPAISSLGTVVQNFDHESIIFSAAVKHCQHILAAFG